MNYALAPAAWLGDWRALGAGDTLAVHVYERLITGTPISPASMFVLEGPGGRATAIPNPSPANDAWTHFAVSLSPSDWTMARGTWGGLLADVQRVQVSAEFVSGEEETRLDNIYLSEAPSPFSHTCILSLLDSGSEDWNIVNTGTITVQPANGDGGGFLQIAEGTGIATAYAGTRFRGDWTAFDGVGAVGLSLRQVVAGTTTLGPVELIRLSGPGGSAHVTVSSADLPPAPRIWKRFEFPITQAAWTVTTGSWAALLADVTEVRLQLEFWSGTETIGFDRFTLRGPGCVDGAPRPVLHVPGITVCDHVSIEGMRSVAHDPSTGRLAGVLDATSTTGGLWWLTGAQAGTRFQACAEAAHAMFAPHGDAFIADDLNGIIYRRTAAGASQVWATGFHAGDDDPLGMCIAPAGFDGAAVDPGDVVVADNGFNGPDEIWAFSATVAESEVQLFASPTERWMFDVAAGAGVVHVADSTRSSQRVELWPDGTVHEYPIAPPVPGMTSVVHDAAGGQLFVVSNRDESVHRIDLASGVTQRVASGFRNLELAALDFDAATRTLWVCDLGAGVTYALCVAGRWTRRAPARSGREPRGSRCIRIPPARRSGCRSPSRPPR